MKRLQGSVAALFTTMTSPRTAAQPSPLSCNAKATMDLLRGFEVSSQLGFLQVDHRRAEAMEIQKEGDWTDNAQGCPGGTRRTT